MGLMGLRFGTVATVVLLVLLRRRRPKESASGSTAITPPPPERPERPRGKPEERGRGHTDLAALLGAVVVVLLTLTSDPGAWGYTSTISSALVLCLLIAFFAAHPSSAAPNFTISVYDDCLLALAGYDILAIDNGGPLVRLQNIIARCYYKIVPRPIKLIDLEIGAVCLLHEPSRWKREPVVGKN
jgi:hypothetical protein